MNDVEALRSELSTAVAEATSSDALEALRIDALGKKGRVTVLMKGLGAMEPEERKAAGQALNALKAEIADAIDARKGELAAGELEAIIGNDALGFYLEDGSDVHWLMRSTTHWAINSVVGDAR